MISLIIQSTLSALQAIRSNGLRSLLTMLGVVIGVSAVLTVVSIIHGLRMSIESNFEGFGANSLTVSAHTSFEAELQKQYSTLTHSDLMAVKRVKGIDTMTPVAYPFQGLANIQFKDKAHSSDVLATNSGYQDVYLTSTTKGRFLVPSDNESRRNVAVIGAEVREKLSLPENPVGQFIQIAGHWFKVVGLLEKQGSFLGISRDNFIVIPYETGKKVAGEAKDPSFSIHLTVTEIGDLTEVKNNIENILRITRGVDELEEADFKVKTSDQITETFSDIFNAVTVVLAGIVSISLLVSGVGIMNIMLVSVTERIREIGIRKAVGASKGDILWQFLIEAVVLSLCGCLIGLLVGFFFVELVKLIPSFSTTYIPLWSINLSLIFSVAVGIGFGILPAWKASNMDPIEALRHD